ncbi:hypothetical protein [Adhaeribacter soli]|uniref:Uncharacterized protein n=1 Tax=Adhaeribacter soli TaxID=2607655 RepID=A0A5N1J4Z9_9BACT|nr:hypothetical protein [Adhaeribacter soli]KAA9345797.1 hypothetical protein F0P94_01550 [Adhaeribacter soli]
MTEGRQRKLDFLAKTGMFSIAGFFLAALPIIGIIGIQQLLNLIGIECSIAWGLIWVLTFIGCVLSPIVFIRFIQRTTLDNEAIGKRLLVFNILEYTFIQTSLGYFFTNGQTLCYLSDGQSGLEFVFTGWLAIPILLILSYIFNQVRAARKKQEELEYQN